MHLLKIIKNKEGEALAKSYLLDIVPSLAEEVCNFMISYIHIAYNIYLIQTISYNELNMRVEDVGIIAVPNNNPFEDTYMKLVLNKLQVLAEGGLFSLIKILVGLIFPWMSPLFFINW